MVSPEQVLGLLRSGKADANLKRSLARGVLPLGPAAMLEALVLLLADKDESLRNEAIKSLRRIPKSVVLGVASSSEASPRLLHVLAKLFSKNQAQAEETQDD